MNYVSVTMWVVLKSNKYRKSLLYSILCVCGFWTTIPFSTNYSSSTGFVFDVFDSCLAVFNNWYNLSCFQWHTVSLSLIKPKCCFWLQATYYAKKSVSTPDHWRPNVCMVKCTDNQIKCAVVIYQVLIYDSAHLCIYRWNELRDRGMEHFRLE